MQDTYRHLKEFNVCTIDLTCRYPRADGMSRPHSRTCNGYPGKFSNSNIDTNDQTQHNLSANHMNGTPQQQQQSQTNSGYNINNPNDSWRNVTNTSSTNEQPEFLQSDRFHLNTRIKSIILNKHNGLIDDEDDKCLTGENEEGRYIELTCKTNQNDALKNNTENFLSHSHHPQNVNTSISQEERSFRDDLDGFLPPSSSSMNVLGNSPQGTNSERDGGDFSWMDKDRLCNPYSENNNHGNWISDFEESKKQDEPYKFAGDGGPAELKDLVGFSCCR